MRMLVNIGRVGLGGCLLICIAGCWSPAVMPVTYENSARVASLSGVSVSVGDIADERGTRSDWLGAVRSGLGSPLKEMRTDGPTSAVVAAVFADALAGHGAAVSKAAALQIRGTIVKFDASQYMRREAHAHLTFQVVEVSSGRVLYSGSKQADKVEGAAGSAAFGNRDALAALASDTLSQAVDKFFVDSDFISALTKAPLPVSAVPPAR